MRSLGSLKDKVDEHFAKSTEGKEGKEKIKGMKMEKGKLHDCINQKLIINDSALRKQIVARKLDEFWKTWSKCVERGILKYLGACCYER